MVSNLSMNRMASMPEMLEPMDRPAFALAKKLISEGEVLVV